jgi:hypothetical protein
VYLQLDEQTKDILLFFFHVINTKKSPTDPLTNIKSDDFLIDIKNC